MIEQISVSCSVWAGVGMSLVFVGSWRRFMATAYGLMVRDEGVVRVPLLLGAANYFIVREGDGIHHGQKQASPVRRSGNSASPTVIWRRLAEHPSRPEPTCQRIP